jgi:signal transduction histidine kinase
VQLYVLDASGRIRASSVEAEYVKRQQIDVTPVEEFVSGATVPTQAQDPASTTDRKVFSAAPIEGPDGDRDYLYVILNGCSAEAIASTFKQTYVWRTFASSLLLALGFTTVVGLVLFWLLTRRFRSLTDVVQRFKEGDYDERADAQKDDEIGQLEQAFNEMADTIAAQVEALRRTDEERRRLVAEVSHDFRTPLTSIRGHVDRLLDLGGGTDGEGTRSVEEAAEWAGDGAPRSDGAPPVPADQWARRLKIIRQNAERLDALSERLHELSRLDAQTPAIEREPFSIAELAHDLVLKFRPDARDHGVSLTLDGDPDISPVRGDIGMIERLLSNLIENAIEHTPPQGDITVRLRSVDAAVEVQVADTGVGIPEGDIPLVTQRFYRVDRSSGEDSGGGTDEGSGLGMAIASEIAEAHESKLEIDSAVGTGTLVRFQLDQAMEREYDSNGY